MMDSTTLLIVLAIALGVVVLVGIWLYSQQRHTKRLQTEFGPEYERAMRQADSRRDGERELEERQKRIGKLEIKELDADTQRRFADDWRLTQARFVDDPVAAIAEADSLVIRVMEARGYPVGDFDARAADISVDHPNVVPNYRAAHAMAEKNKSGKTSTEELRQAMVHYRSLFDELLGATTARADTNAAGGR
jgi:hypothetical protein